MSSTSDVSLAEQLEAQMRPPRWTPAMFRAACNAGCFEDMRVELVGGELVAMTDNPPHTRGAVRGERLLWRLLPETDWFVVREIYVDFPGWTPRPDVTVCRGPLDPAYADRRPSAADVVLIVEVSDTTYLKDRRVKLPRYALAGIPYCWIVNLERSRVEVYSQPEGRRYRTRQEYGEADEVPVILDGTHYGTIPVREILPTKRAGQ
jgi:Uma2 family endonuclease